MPAQGFSSPFDLGLPDNPVDVPDEFYETISSIFNAIKILQQGIGVVTGAQTQDTTNFLAAPQKIQDTLHIGRMSAIQVVCGDGGGMAAGHMVNLYDGGGLRARRAQANSMTTRAHGYVDQAVANGDVCAVYLWAGYLLGGGLTTGATYYLSSSTPGALTTTAPVTPGMIRQEVGVGLSGIDLAVKIATPIQL